MIEPSPKQNIFLQKLVWFYFDAPAGILKAWRNFILFNLEYFSVVPLSKTLFSHWRRYGYSYPKGFDIKKSFEIFASNMISRILGFLMRSVLILFGLSVEVIVLASGAVVFFAWLVLPFALALGIWRGVASI